MLLRLRSKPPSGPPFGSKATTHDLLDACLKKNGLKAITTALHLARIAASPTKERDCEYAVRHPLVLRLNSPLTEYELAYTIVRAGRLLFFAHFECQSTYEACGMCKNVN